MKLVFDVGATNTRIARVNDGALNNVHEFETDASLHGLDTLITKLAELADGHQIEVMAGDVPGTISDGVLVSARNLPDWKGAKIVEKLSTHFACSVKLYNDAILCGVGEAHFGSGKPSGEMLYFTISSGVNGVRLINGFPDNSLPEYNLGRMIVSGGPHQAADLESLIGGAAIEKRTGHHPRDIRDPEFWQQEAGYLARGVYNARLMWNPQLVVFGGSMMNDISLDQIERVMAELPPAFNHGVELRRAKLHSEAGLYGAMVYLEK